MWGGCGLTFVLASDDFMQRAIRAALDNVRSGRGGPFGAVIVKAGEVVATGVNLVTFSNDPTAHAEMTAIRGAAKTLEAFQLDGCEIYCSCEPCPMCLSAIYWARLDRIYYGATSADAAAAQFDDRFIYDQLRLEKDARSIPMVQLSSGEVQAPFRAWKEKLDRIPY
jgi:guanine deaminase